MESTSDCPKKQFSEIVKNDVKQNIRFSHVKHDTDNMTTTNEWNKVRFLICVLGLIGLAMSQMSRSVLNITITSMVPQKKENDTGRGSDSDSCPWPQEEEVEVEQSKKDDQFEKLNETMKDENIQSEVDTFDWDVKQRNLLLGGFFYSYPVFMVAGGSIAEIYGVKYVLLTAVAGSGLINLLTPWMARNSFALLVLSRIVMGAIQAGAFPAMYALFNEWLTMSEASIFAPLIKVNLRLGALLGTALSGIIVEWPNVFYSAGYVSLVWSILWMIFATSQPKDNNWVSKMELAHIVRKKLTKLKDLESGSKSNQKRSTPWIKIITAPSVIALIIIKLTFNFGIDFVVILLPTYLKSVHHMSRQRISAIMSSQLFLQTALIVVVGWFAKTMVKRRPFGLTKTSIRKLFQSTASYGIALCMLLLAFNGCSSLYLIVVLQLLSFLCMFTAGGETMLPYDLSERYPATIMAVANSIANTSASITTTLNSIILGKEDTSYHRWSIFMVIISAANLIGASIFNLIVRAEPINFGDDDAQEISPEVRGNSLDTPKIIQSKLNEDTIDKSPDDMTKIQLEVTPKATDSESTPALNDTVTEKGKEPFEEETVEENDTEATHHSLDGHVNVSAKS